MVKTAELKADIIRAGYTYKTAAIFIGISRASFSYKINNKRSFTVREYLKLMELLGIQSIEKFFTKYVDI